MTGDYDQRVAVEGQIWQSEVSHPVDICNTTDFDLDLDPVLDPVISLHLDL